MLIFLSEIMENGSYHSYNKRECKFLVQQDLGGGAVDESVRSANGMLGVRIPAAIDLSRKSS